MAAALVATATVLLHLLAAPAQAKFQFAPVLSVYATAEGDSSTYDGAKLVCSSTGGYLACEPTAALHEAGIQEANKIKSGIYYAYLGGDTAAKRSPQSIYQCPVDRLAPNSDASWANAACVWHWNQGRWIELQDDLTLYGNVPDAGVAFYLTNTWQFPNAAGPANDMANYFYNESTDGTHYDRRPGLLFGQQMVVHRAGSDTAYWSDNYAGPGYAYQNYTLGTSPLSTRFDRSSIATTTGDFIALCNVGTPTRVVWELSNTSSGLQANWWAIFFAILFVICLVIFIIVACCQEREDMDEPPEDAPEWAQQQADDGKNNRQFMSQRSFRTYEDDDDDGGEGAGDYSESGNTRNNSRSGSTARPESNRTSGRGSQLGMGSEKNYYDEEDL